MRSKLLRASALVLLVALSACGGGGGGGKPNAVPSVSNGTLQIDEDQAGTVPITGSDPDGDRLAASISAAPTKGAASVAGAGPFVITYTPNRDANGSDTVAFQINDGRGGIATGQVNVTIAPVPDAPVIETREFAASEDVTLSERIAASDPDGDAVTLTVTRAATNGTVQIADASTGQFTYQPTADFNGTDSFEVRASDGSLNTDAVVNLAVQAVNDTPVAATDNQLLAVNTTSAIDVLANDSDIEGGALTVVEVLSQPAGANAVVAGTQISVTPAADMAGPTSFDYRISDADGGVATGRVNIVFGSAKPLFFLTVDAASAERHIERYDYFSRNVLNTPVNAGERLVDFITSADASRMVYTTLITGFPNRHRLWLKDLRDDSVPVEEIPTASNFFTRWLAISDDGNHIAFNGSYVHATRPNQPGGIGADVERPSFSRDGQRIFYVRLFSGGGRAIFRADIDPVFGPTGETRITDFYGTAEGLGLDYTLTPDETKVVSNGLFLIPPFDSVKPISYVSPVNGPMNDVRLHQQVTTVVDGSQQPAVTADSRYAYYSATLNGINGIFATDLQAPGTEIRMDVNPSSEFPGGQQATADSSTLFYALTTWPNSRWFYTTFTQPSVSTPFAPLGLPQTSIRTVTPAPQGAYVIFTVGSALYVTQAPYASATTLLSSIGGSTTLETKYAPDSNAVAAKRSTDGSRIFVVNPKAPGWQEDLGPRATESVTCYAFPGERCAL